jgi:multiple antibiotic resistance protein
MDITKSMWNPLISNTFSTLAVLFPIANPLGAVPIFYSLTAEDKPDYRLQQAHKTALNVIWVLITFLLGSGVK